MPNSNKDLMKVAKGFGALVVIILLVWLIWDGIAGAGTKGCMEKDAYNFNKDATEDDPENPCIYETVDDPVCDISSLDGLYNFKSGLTNFTANDFCKENYQLDQTYTCGADGVVTPTLGDGSCVETVKGCMDPNANNQVSGANTDDPNDPCTYDDPVCNISDLSTATGFKNITTNFTVGAEVTGFCADTYHPDQTYTCGADGVVTPTLGVGSCVETVCNISDLSTATGFKNITTNFTVGAEVTGFCADTYHPDQTYTCGADGVVTPTLGVGSCVETVCNISDLSNILTGFKNITTDFTVGAEVTDFCEENYQPLDPDQTYTCGENGVVTPALGVGSCVETVCNISGLSDLPGFKNITTNFTVGAEVTDFCKDDYHPDKDDYTCGTDGVSPPLVEESCVKTVYGCMDDNYGDYKEEANVGTECVEDCVNDKSVDVEGSCVPIVYGCMDDNYGDYKEEANVGTECVEDCVNGKSVDVDGSCVPIVEGCMESDALNYNSLANKSTTCVPFPEPYKLFSMNQYTSGKTRFTDDDGETYIIPTNSIDGIPCIYKNDTMFNIGTIRSEGEINSCRYMTNSGNDEKKNTIENESSDKYTKMLLPHQYGPIYKTNTDKSHLFSLKQDNGLSYKKTLCSNTSFGENTSFDENTWFGSVCDGTNGCGDDEKCRTHEGNSDSVNYIVGMDEDDRQNWRDLKAAGASLEYIQDQGDIFNTSETMGCDVTAPANGIIGGCDTRLDHDESCTPICDTGYVLNNNFSCDDGELTQAECTPTTLGCEGVSVSHIVGEWDNKKEVIYDDNFGGMGTCVTTLNHGESCTPTCADGYKITTDFSCNNGYLTPALCEEKASCGVTAPANGNMGNCDNTLDHGGECTPVCDEKYEVVEENVCDDGNLTEATCRSRLCDINFDNKINFKHMKGVLLDEADEACGTEGMTETTLLTGTSCKPKCNDDFRLHGQFTCGSSVDDVTGKYELTEEPVCVPKIHNPLQTT